jgi:lipooligosaccharide transport system ATP-binding protein
MDEAEQLCDHLVVMDKAKIVAEGSPRQLIDRHSTREVLELRVTDALRDGLDGQFDGLADRIEELPDRLLLYTADGERTLEQVNLRKIPIESALVRRSSMEDVFLRLTGRSLVE